MKFKLRFASSPFNEPSQEVEINTIKELEALAIKYEDNTWGNFGASVN